MLQKVLENFLATIYNQIYELSQNQAFMLALFIHCHTKGNSFCCGMLF